MGGANKKNNYSLVEQEFTTKDPYSSKVNFPSTAQECHCGGSALEQLHAEFLSGITKLKDHAINSLGTKLAIISNNDENVEPRKKRQRLELKKREKYSEF